MTTPLIPAPTSVICPLCGALPDHPCVTVLPRADGRQARRTATTVHKARSLAAADTLRRPLPGWSLR